MKASLIAVALVVLSVVGVVLLTGVTRKPQKPPAPVISAPVAPSVEVPPFPDMDGVLWNLTSVDARIRIPTNWTLGRVNGDERLLRNEADPLDGNMNLLLMPNAFGLSLDDLLRENLEELAVNPDLHLEDRREIYVMGRKVLRFDYNGTPRNGSEPMRFVAVVWRRGKYQVVLTTTVRAVKWGEVAAEVDGALESLQIRWPAERSK